MATVKVIIVNYNAGKHLAHCVGSVLSATLPLTVVVADNASSDDSIAALANRFGLDSRLQILRNEHNLGFARAVNRVAREAREDYLLVLNPDCVLKADTIEQLVHALEVHPQAGVAGPWVTDESGSMQSGTWRRFPDPWRSLMTLSGVARVAGESTALAGVDLRGSAAPEAPVRVDAVSGACLMLRRTAAQKVGYYDEGYAMHCEDLDLMFRLTALGHYCVLVPQAAAVHAGGVSTASRPWWVHRHKHLGMQRFYRKFQAGEHAFPLRWAVYAGIWCHYLLTLPVVLVKRGFGRA
ncbi:MAG: glycosyltransferase family 2 protein [Xanthomonadales bacterium]|nr:glycosyltransferase family 2 protein [Xanthomonadales bacterium]